MIERNLGKYAKYFSGYTELRLQENRNLDITLLNGNLISNESNRSGGVSARVCQNGSWGFSSTPIMDEDAVRAAIRAASENAAFLDSRQKMGRKVYPDQKLRSEHYLGTVKKQRTRKEVVEFLREVDAYVVSTCKNLASRKLWFGGLEIEKSLLTSVGGVVYSMVPRTRLILFLSAEKDGKKADLSRIFGACGQFEDVFENSAALFRGIEELSDHLNKKLEGVSPEAGTWDCILGPDMSGMLAHEAVGHTVEADNVRAGSVARNFLGKQVGGEIVNLTDFANTAFGRVCPVPVYADDEGTMAEDVKVIENGRLNSYLHNKESAEYFRGKAAGNARAATFSDEPIIRMRNTAFLPGNSSVDEMIASVDNGYYFVESGNGQADSTSEFMFGVVIGYEVKNGRIGRPIKDTTVSGIAYEVLKSVSMVSKEFEWLSGAMCSKLQRVPVGMGGPFLKCRLRVGGH